MSSKQQSPRQSQTSSPLPSPQPAARSLIVSNFSFDGNEKKLLTDLGHNYIGVDKISQLYNKKGQPMNMIRIDFKSDSLTKKILDNGHILIDGKRHLVQPYFPPLCDRYQNEGHHMSQYPQKPFTEQRLMEIFHQQQKQLESMINAFENKWNTRLSSLTVPSTNVNVHVDQLLPIFKELTTVCQQFNQQNAQMQQQLTSVVNQVRNAQMKLTNAQTQSQVSLQNGH